MNNTILIVDDIPEDVDILRELLVDFKQKVALNGKTALQIIEETPPDIILLDIIMPGISGYYVCEQVKANEKTKDIPIIFITAMDEVTDKTKGFQLGAVDYITKPFQPEEVLSRIKTHLELNNYRKRLQNINQELQIKVDERTAELMKEKDNAVKAHRIKSEFLMLMSHELRTPMVGILGFSNILKNEIIDPAHKEITETLYSAAERLKDTINSILALSQLESKKLSPHIIEIDIITKIEYLLCDHKIKADIKNIKIEFEPSQKEFYTKLDPIMFEVIFNNLISNAIKFTDQGSVEIKIFEKDEHHCLKISDTGIGIPSDKHQVIFEEFRQVDEGVCRNFQGIGLGLSLVKKYTELHNGKISFKSEEQKGTSITVMFPQTISASNQIVKKEIKFNVPVKLDPKLNLLLVEDDDTNIHIAKLYLENYANVDSVKSGVESLELVNKNCYSVILMDINLGSDLNGIETSEEIRKSEKNKNTPIIAFTSFATVGEKEKFLAEGFTHYISKPFTKKELQSVILNAIEYKDN